MNANIYFHVNRHEKYYETIGSQENSKGKYSVVFFVNVIWNVCSNV